MTHRVALLVAVEAAGGATDAQVAAYLERVLAWALADGVLRPVRAVAWVAPVPLRPGWEVQPALESADTEGHDDEHTTKHQAGP